MAVSVPPFVHLHNHSTYSLLDGAQRIDEMCARAAADGQTAIAVTDHGGMFGVMQLGKKAKKHGIKPIVGLEAYIAVGSRLDRSLVTVPGVGKRNYFHLILLAENYIGFKNLIKLSTAGYLDGFYYRPRIDKQILQEHAEGLICTTSCLAGEVPTLLHHDRYNQARDAAAEFRDLFGEGRFWLEAQDHGLPEQKIVNEQLPRLSRELGVPIVAANDCHYLLPDDHEAHDVLVCLNTGNTINSKTGMTYSSQHYQKSRAEMAELFASMPEAVENSAAIAERCTFTFDKQPLHLPAFPVPEGYDLDGYFEKVAREGLAMRMSELRHEHAAGRLLHRLEDYETRLAHEIKVIHKMGYSGYFLITWDFIRYARESGIPVGPGRGSAAGSLVAYSMRITDLDPLQFKLIFERFLNSERVSMPDIDIDFCFRRREQVIDYVTRKYGRENVAQIITFGTMAARAVIRDVGRVLEIPYSEVDRIAKLVPVNPNAEVTIDKALQEVPALREAYQKESSIKELLDIGRRLEGLTRHASTHAAGVVIAPEPIVEFTPLYRGTKEGDEITTQWAKDEIEEIGLLKLDFLGLKTLTLIDDAKLAIEAEQGKELDIDGVPLDDAAVFDLFCHARTSGIFQFESEGMKDILRRLKPEKFEDLIALNALYRPGPIGGGLIDDFIKGRHGKVKVRYPHPLLEDILRDTYGVIVYQEQVMQIASVMGGYTLGEADILRRAMGKKSKEVMEAEEQKFIKQAQNKDIKPATAKKVFDLISFFAGYGFNRSHSAAYALVAYRTAWLKAHYPVHFMAALLTTEKGNTDKMVKYINESREMGIEIMPPDINSSSIDFSARGEKIRFGLSAIKNVGEGAIRSILEARRSSGELKSLHALCEAVDSRVVNKRVLEALIRSGSLDSMGARRSQLEAIIDSALDYGQKRRADRESGQSSLFASGPERWEKDDESGHLPDIPDWDEKTRLTHEKASLGFYVSGHPLESFSDLLGEFATHTINGLREAKSGIEVAIGGVISEVNRRRSKKGAWWATVQLEDLQSHIEVLLFPKCYEVSQAQLEQDRPIMIIGKLESDEDRVRVIADSIQPLDNLRERQVEQVQIKINAADLDDDLVYRVLETLQAHRGSAKVLLEVVRTGSYSLLLRAEAAIGVKASKELTGALEALTGPNSVLYKTKAML
jgi:DNA polymerase-3 subunit alpha